MPSEARQKYYVTTMKFSHVNCSIKNKFSRNYKKKHILIKKALKPEKRPKKTRNSQTHFYF